MQGRAPLRSASYPARGRGAERNLKLQKIKKNGMRKRDLSRNQKTGAPYPEETKRPSAARNRGEEVLGGEKREKEETRHSLCFFLTRGSHLHTLAPGFRGAGGTLVENMRGAEQGQDQKKEHFEAKWAENGDQLGAPPSRAEVKK